MTIPNGMDDRDYAHLRKSKGKFASSREFAWEFLRRNKEFQNDCIEVTGGRANPGEIAEKWNLRWFKDFRQGFRESPKATFNISRVLFFGSMGPQARPIRVTLLPGQVAMVVDLTHIGKYKQVLDAKMNYAALGLKRRALEYQKAIAGPDAGFKIVAGNLIRYLRAFDLQGSGMKGKDIRQILHDRKSNTVDQRTADSAVWRDLRAAKKYIEGEFLALAVRHYANKKRSTFNTRPRKNKA